jgi:hypothetical protein
MCQITGREKEGWLTTKNIQDFPSADLERIDQLWMHYSNGKFGFSIQKKLWLECGGKIGRADKTIRKKFAGKVGWYHPQNTNWMTHSEFMNSTRNAQNSLPASLPRWVRVSAMELSGEEGRFETLLSRKELLALEVAVTQNVAPIKNLVAVELRSEKWIDYRELEKLLKQKEWRKADEMTNMLMLRVCDREKEGFLLGEHIASFSCQDLLTIDQLWHHYSDGKFGFTVQVKLCQEYCKFDKYDKSEEEAYKKLVLLFRLNYVRSIVNSISMTSPKRKLIKNLLQKLVPTIKKKIIGKLTMSLWNTLIMLKSLFLQVYPSFGWDILVLSRLLD